ncbi:MAG: CpsD/CapB family tyrosine-protein kinase [Pseudomonadota bacterium]
MDRIRQAVLRAREDQPKNVSVSPSPTIAAANAHPAQRTTPLEDFQEVECDFSNFGRNRIISNEQDPVLNSYRVLRTRVLQKMDENGWKTIAVASPASGAGKSVTAINLAIAIGSKHGSRSTLIDLDFYRPSVARYLGLEEFPSTLDYFEGKKTLKEVTVRPNLPNTLVLANERVSRRGAEHLTSARADEMIDRAVNEYQSRAVIFDMSPLLGCDDTLAFLPKIDCILLIAASGQTRVAELKESKRLLEDANLIGTVLNKAPSALAPNYYYY